MDECQEKEMADLREAIAAVGKISALCGFPPREQEWGIDPDMLEATRHSLTARFGSLALEKESRRA